MGFNLIFFYISLKLILVKNLNDTNFIYRLGKTQDESKIDECITDLLDPKKIEEKTKNIVCILEFIRDNPNNARNITNTVLQNIRYSLKYFLKINDIEFMYDFLNEIFYDNEKKFIDNLFDVIEIHPEIMNYTLTLVNENITNYGFFKAIQNILNIDGMDKISEYIINSTYNDAILKYIDAKLLNGTDYAIINETFYPSRDKIFRLMHKILKGGLFTSEKELNQNATVVILEFIRDYPQISRDIFKFLKLYISDNKEILATFLNNTDKEFLYNFTEEIFSENCTFFNDLIDIVIIHPELINYTLVLLLKKDAQGREVNRTEYFTTLKKILNTEGVAKFFTIFKKYFFDIIKLIPKEMDGGRTVYSLLLEVEPLIFDFKDKIIDIMIKIASNFLDYNGTIEVLRDFFLNECNEELLKNFSRILTNKTIAKKLSSLVNIDKDVANAILKQIIENVELMKIVFELLNDTIFIKNLSDTFINLYNNEYIKKNVPIFLKYIIGNNITVKNIIINAFKNMIRNVITERSLKSSLTKALSKVIENLLFKNFTELQISPSCSELINYTYFRTLENVSEDFRFYFSKKLFIDSTKSKNDFLTYENCLDGLNDSIYNSTTYKIKPIYIVGKIIDKVNQSKLKNSIYYEKYNYMFGFCFPYGINVSTNQSLCSSTDYGNLILVYNSLLHNVNLTNISVFNITAEDLKRKSKHILYFSLVVIISAIPLLISIFLKLYEKIKLSNLQKNEINNELKLENQNIDNNALKSNEIQKSEFLYRKKPPKWFRYLNEYFNLVKNGNELFNFTLNQTNFNDFNGITYIKGILGISMILNIFGLTFLVVANLLTKILGSYQFYDSIYNLVYIFAFIALRYSPRIIFSCSGYTLIYKFLNFIEHDSNFSFFKFLILQSYKFILLILAVIYLRFCLYYIDVFFLKIKNPISEAFNKELNDYNEGFFYNLISFLFYNIKDENEIFANESAFILYLYIPINEIILFIIGIALISFGYKFKLRFDIIIIIFFLLIYLFKLIIFIVHLYKKEIYSTLYFFLHGYGILMFNPIFNIPSFLVGMYFGLVNFTIQRGINDLNEDEKNNNEYELLEKEQISPLKENKDEELKKIDIGINNISENDRISRSLTFSRQSSSIHDENNIYVKNEDNISFKAGYKKAKKNLDINAQEDTNDILIDLPFLKSTVNFTNFHRKNQDKKLLKIILAISIILILFFIFVRFIFIYANITKEIENNNENLKVVDISGEKENNLANILSLEKIITNYFLNILYVIDIELVVIMINWIFFYLYFKGGQINDFLSHIYWSFFIKSYFSYTLVSGLVILYILYQSETVIKLNLYTICFYSLISSFFIFIATIIFYSCYEYPLRKIFKTLKIRRSYINLDDDEFYEEENEDGYLQ